MNKQKQRVGTVALVGLWLLAAIWGSACNRSLKQSDARAIERAIAVASATTTTQRITEADPTEVDPTTRRRSADSINRQSILFLLDLEGPSPNPRSVIAACRRMGFGSALFEFPRIWLDGWPNSPPYSAPRAMWPGGDAEAARYFRALKRAGINVGAQMPLHQPPDGCTVEAHATAIADLCGRLGLTQIMYADGAENIGHPLHVKVDRVIDVYLARLSARPAIIQSSVGSLCHHETRGGQTDYHWYSENRVKEARRAIVNAARYARQHNVAADGGWLTDTVPGGDGRVHPLSPIEVDTIWALALGHDVALTFRTSEVNLRVSQYGDATTFSMRLLEQLRRVGGGGERWAYLREPLLPDQWGWMRSPLANPPVIAAYEVPHPARCDSRLRMFSGELGGDHVVMVWASESMTIEFDVGAICPEARLLRVMDHRGRAIPTGRTSSGRDRLTVGAEQLWMVIGPRNKLPSRSLKIAMRSATIVSGDSDNKEESK